MIKIFIQGIHDGQHDINMQIPVEEVEDIYPEYYGNIQLTGKLRKLGNRYTFKGKVSCNAELVCDISLKKFTKEISSDLNVSFLADTFLYQMSKHGDQLRKSESNDIIIAEDDKYIDLTNEICEELAVSIPMKRIAPEYEGKSFEDIYPQFTPESQSKKKGKKKQEIDERWEPLKKLKLN